MSPAGCRSRRLACRAAAALRRFASVGVALLAALLVPTPAAAADRVLVMTISAYPRAPLQGVTHDADNALRLARRLGYDTADAVVLKDRQLTGAGLRAAFDTLLARVRRNDRVFVYYSGHGYSLAQRSTCVQGLVAQDETLIPTAELSERLDGVKALVSDALVIFDACFSGGNRDIAVTRSFEAGDTRTADGPGTTAPLHAKVWTPRGGERCEAATNELAKAWQPPDPEQVTRALAFPKSNFTFLAAATDREVALDDRERGGLATLGLLECADAGVPGTTGPVTALELAACAQGHVARNVDAINAKLQNRSFLPHQLGVYGNGERLFAVRSGGVAPGSGVPSGVSAADAAAGASGTGATAGTGGTGGTGATAVAPGSTPRRADLVLAAFRRLVANSNGNWALGVEPSVREAPVGTTVRLRLRTGQPGYVQLLYVGSDRREIARVWPAAGQLRRVAAADAELPVGLTLAAPAGTNTVLVVLSREPLDLSAVLAGGSAAAAPAVLDRLGCAFVRQRNLIVKEDAPAPGPCADASGANTPPDAASRPPPADAESGADGYTARIVTLVGTRSN